MRTLKDYNLPDAMLDIERKLTPKQIASLVEESSPAALKSSETNYVNAFRKMLHFEEACESQFLLQFNTRNIRLKNVCGREYCIRNDVSTTRETTTFGK